MGNNRKVFSKTALTMYRAKVAFRKGKVGSKERAEFISSYIYGDEELSDERMKVIQDLAFLFG